MTLKENIVQLLQNQPGLTDREITDRLLAPGNPQQPVNGACRALEAVGVLIWRKEAGRLRNYLDRNAAPDRRSQGRQADDVVDVSRRMASGNLSGRTPTDQKKQRVPEDLSRPDIDRLLKIGFRHAGKWVLRGGRPVLRIQKDAPTSRNVLYAFVTDGSVRYVGKTTLGLHRRLYGYQHPGPTQRTNLRNHERIQAALGDGGWVDIYAMPDPGLHAFGEFQINLAAGLEDSIIRSLKPEWNS